MLTTTELIGCDKSRDILLRLASFVSQRFDADGLSQLEPDTFISLVRATCGTSPGVGEGSEGQQQQQQQQQPSRDYMLGSKQVQFELVFIRRGIDSGEIHFLIYHAIISGGGGG